jgi:trimeric autotransporter adhesin
MYYANNQASSFTNFNVALGYEALRGSTTASANTGNYNTATGYQALWINSTGSSNTVSGYQALFTNTTGSDATAIGQGALYSNTTGSQNTASGRDALRNNNTGNRNVAMGNQALGMNGSGTQLTSNVAIGYRAGGTMTSGYGNVLMGEEAGKNLTTGFDNTWIGKQIGISGTLTYNNSTAIGNGTPVDANNKARIGNASVNSIGGQVAWSNFSDARIKDNVKDNVVGLEFIKALRPVTYNFNVDRQNSLLGLNPEHSVGMYDIQHIVFSGFLAQDVDKAAQAVGYDFSGVDRSGTLLGLRYAEFTVPLVKAVQELDGKVEALKPAALDSLEAAVAAQQQQLQQQQQEMAALNRRNAAMEQQMAELLSRLDAFDTDLQQCCFEHSAGTRVEGQGTSDSNDAPALEQNIPNPFHENTTIKYYLPNGMRTASIVVIDLSGVQLKTFDIGGMRGFGQVLISGGAFAAGTYIYTLVVNGQQVDSKRMVLL